MPRKPRIEYAGAVYHVMCRGNSGADIFLSDADRALFMQTLDEACDRCGWKAHAFVLMSNHYHILLETPEPNLVAGMKWMQGTYTQRFNRRNDRNGHLFQGRYKALVIDGGKGEYFSTVAGYIHLNPARARLFDRSGGGLEEYAWSSFPLYLNPSERPDWLRVERVLGNFQWKDDSSGRRDYGRHMRTRAREMADLDDPENLDAGWKDIRRGWFLGDDAFREELMDRIGNVMSGKQRGSFSGQQVEGHDLVEAERLVRRGLDAFGLNDADLENLKKNCPEKYAIAWLARRNTCVKNQWIKDRLRMGKATNFSSFLARMESRQFGVPEFERVKNIIS